MKRHYLQMIVIAAVVLLSSLRGHSADFTVNGINYYVYDRAERTVGVTWASSSYQGDITIPATITANDTVWTVVHIGDFAFMQESKMKSISLPVTVRSIGDGAFAYCSGLTSVQLPAATRYIGNVVFAYCSALKRVEFPDSADFLGTGTLSYTAVDSVVIPKGLISLPAQTFEQCLSLSSVTLPEGITEIGFQAFQNTISLKSLTLPSTLQSVGNGCFAFSGLQSLHLPAAMRSYGDNAITGLSALTAYSVDAANEYFSSEDGVLYSKDGRTLNSFPLGCGMTSFTVKNGVDSIADFAFYGNALENISLPATLCSIGKSAFGTSSAITSIVIPDAVKHMGPYSFFGCEQLKEVTFGSGLESLGNGAFSSTEALRTVICRNITPAIGAKFTDATYANGKLLVPEVAVEAYKEASGWKEFNDIQTSGVGAITTEMANIIFAGGYINVVCNACVMVEIYDITGRCLHRGYGAVSIPGSTGAIYVVHAGDKTVKGMLR